MGMKLKALIVEDESLVAMLIEDLLLDLGYDVVAMAGQLDHAVRVAGEVEVDFAVLDLNLHGQLTYPVAEALARRGIPIVFATGYGAAGLPPEWADRPVLQKPFQQHELRGAIDSALRR
ncbi:MAG: response regulator [Hyphomonadaceae bacterium]|nr:response regulator [Hyphomonadaceae bacterium]